MVQGISNNLQQLHHQQQQQEVDEEEYYENEIENIDIETRKNVTIATVKRTVKATTKLTKKCIIINSKNRCRIKTSHSLDQLKCRYCYNNNNSNHHKCYNKRIGHGFSVAKHCFLAILIIFMLMLCGNNVNSQQAQPQQQQPQQQNNNNNNNLLQTINTTTPSQTIHNNRTQNPQQQQQQQQLEDENGNDNNLAQQNERKSKYGKIRHAGSKVVSATPTAEEAKVATPSTTNVIKHQPHKVITKTSTSTSISSSSSSSSSTSTSSSSSTSHQQSSINNLTNPTNHTINNQIETTTTTTGRPLTKDTEAAAAGVKAAAAAVIDAGNIDTSNLAIDNLSLNDSGKQRDGESNGNNIKYKKTVIPNRNNRNNNNNNYSSNNNNNNKITNSYDQRDRNAHDNGDGNNNHDDHDNNDDNDDDDEMLNESEDGFDSVSSTTLKALKPSVAPHNSAQERERRLMNVLAARRNALHRAGVRSRVATTSRSSNIATETTSRSTPTDPRSICIRNCTKNFTRRTTASCMRQCSNFSRKSEFKQNLLKSDIKIKEKDTNEILFSDESSHSVLVIAKGQNDTLNHIPDEKKSGSGFKLRSARRKGSALNTVTVASTSIEDDEIQPYLYFGQKLPPLKPNTLTITSVSEDHPKLLEVAVSKELLNITSTTTTTTTPPTSTTTTTTTTPRTSTLSAVERSRARFKYNMRGGVSFNTRRYNPFSRVPLNEIKANTLTNPITTSSTTEATPTSKPSTGRWGNLKVSSTAIKEKTTPFVPSSTPLLIAVIGEDELATTLAPSTTTLNTTPALTNSSTVLSTTNAEATKISTTTASTTIETTEKLSTLSISSSIKTTTAPPTTTTVKPIASTTSNTANTNTTPANIESTTRNIIEEDRELLRALGPSLTEINDQPNLVIFVNRSSDVYMPKEPEIPSTSTSSSPKSSVIKSRKTTIPNSITTEASPTILRTTILTSIRSTVNIDVRTKEKATSTTEAPSTKLLTKSNKSSISYSESNDNDSQLLDTNTTTLTKDIGSTEAAKDKTLSTEVQRMNIVTMVLAGIGVVPLMAVVLYLLRNYILKRPLKDNEDFDCITDQQPISPVKKLDCKYDIDDDNHHQYHHNNNNDEVDLRKPPQRQHSQVHKLILRDHSYNANYMHNGRFNDDKSSIISDREFDRSNIRLKSLLGEGNFGQVWKAEADDLSGHFGATRIVAVKTIRACSTQVSLKEEANIMRKLGSHQNVVTLLGACVETEPHMIIMEYAMRGRLLSLLRAARNATNILPASVPGGRSQTPLSPRTLAGFCLDIACGMEYIAGKRIVHRDLAARNVLLDHNGVCKICDFGMSIDLDAERKRKMYEKNCANEIMRSNFNKFKFDFSGKFIINHWPQNPEKVNLPQSQSQTHHHQTNELKKTPSHHAHDTISRRPALPIRWMAPESLQYHVFTRETDIWAFGIVLWEIATLGSTPYSHITGREVIRRVPQGLRPDLPKEGGRHEFYNLMSRCWHKDPQMRPSFTQARLEITRSLHQWIDDDTASNSDYMDVSGFSEDLEHGMVYFNHRISEFECEI